MRWVLPALRLSAWRQFLSCNEGRGTQAEPGNKSWVEGRQGSGSREAKDVRILERSPNIHWKVWQTQNSTISSIQSNITTHRKKWEHVTHAQERNQFYLSLLANLESQIYPPAWNNQNTDMDFRVSRQGHWTVIIKKISKRPGSTWKDTQLH